MDALADPPSLSSDWTDMQSSVPIDRHVGQMHDRDQLTMDHLKFVRRILRKIVSHLPWHVDREDLESAGIVGLLEASSSFESHRGTAFTTYAYPRIRGAIIDELRRNSPLPQRTLQQITKVRQACESLEPPVSPEAISQEVGIGVREVEHCLEAIQWSRTVTWHESTATVLEDHIDLSPQAAAVVEDRETKELLADAINKLPKRERLVVTLYYVDDLRLKEIGRVLNLSESRVSRILTGAKLRLRRHVRSVDLR